MPVCINAVEKKKAESSAKVPLDRSDMVNSLKASEWFLEPGALRNKDAEIPYIFYSRTSCSSTDINKYMENTLIKG